MITALKLLELLAALEKFETFFGLKLGFLFSAAEETSKVLQVKDLTIQKARVAVNTTWTFFSVNERMNSLTNFIQVLLK